MVVDLGFLSTSVDVPLWFLGVLGGFQRVTKLLGDARERRRRRREEGKKKAARGGRR